ncbi:hypothetical protein FI667_g17084, partial [Globisporangium splendens]
MALVAPEKDATASSLLSFCECDGEEGGNASLLLSDACESEGGAAHGEGSCCRSGDDDGEDRMAGTLTSLNNTNKKDEDDGNKDHRRSSASSSLAASDSSRSRRRRQENPQDLKTCMQSMKGQVVFLQTMMDKIALIEKERRLSGHNDDSFGDLSRLSFSSLSPVRKSSVDVIAFPDAHFKKEMLSLDNWNLDQDHQAEQRDDSRSSFITESTNTQNELERENAMLKQQLGRQSEQSKKQIDALLDDIEALKRRIESTEQENEHLRSVVEELKDREKKVSCAVDQDASIEFAVSTHSSSNQDDHECSTTTTRDADEKVHVAAAGVLDQVSDDAKLIHTNHERCQEKIHELWQTIKNLKVYVETFRIEKDDMTKQRNEAIASAERAWKQNTKLAGNTNPAQKIKYLQAVKDENAELMKKIRDLQSQLAATQVKRAVKKVNPFDSEESQSDLLSFNEESVLLEGCDTDDVEPERSVLFRKMWHHNKQLEAEIQRLREGKRKVSVRRYHRSRSESVESVGSSRSNGSNNSTKPSTSGGNQSQHGS